MGKVAIDKSMSLDGYITGPNPSPQNPLGDGGGALFGWMMAPQPAESTPEAGRALSEEYHEQLADMASVGAVIMGKRSFENIDSPDGWVAPDGTAFAVPVVVMTHEVREPVTKGETAFTFANGGPAEALAKAKTA